MRHLLALVAAVAALSLAFNVGAKDKKEKKDKDRDNIVVVTMKDGSLEKGKVTKYWYTLLKTGFNKTFKMDTDDGRDITVDVEQIDSLYFPMRDSMAFRTYRPALVAKPKIGNKNNVEKWICAVGKRSEHAQIYMPDIWVHYQATPTQQRSDIMFLPSIMLEGDSVAYPFYYYRNGNLNTGVLKHWTKQSHPKLEEHIKAYFKVNKKAKKELGDKPWLMLDVYEDYLKNNNPE